MAFGAPFMGPADMGCALSHLSDSPRTRRKNPIRRQDTLTSAHKLAPRHLSYNDSSVIQYQLRPCVLSRNVVSARWPDGPRGVRVSVRPYRTLPVQSLAAGCSMATIRRVARHPLRTAATVGRFTRWRPINRDIRSAPPQTVQCDSLILKCAG